MPGDPDQIVVAGTGTLYLAPYGTALPANPPTTAVRETLNAAFIDMGYTSEDGVALTDGVEVNDINAWQSQYPVRRVVAGYTGKVAFTLIQWSKDIWEQVFHGVVTEPVADTVHLFTPTRDGVVAEKSLVLDVDDGATQYRFVFPKVSLSGDLVVPLVDTEEAEIPTEWGVLGGDAQGPWWMATDNAEFTID